MRAHATQGCGCLRQASGGFSEKGHMSRAVQCTGLARPRPGPAGGLDGRHVFQVAANTTLSYGLPGLRMLHACDA